MAFKRNNEGTEVRADWWDEGAHVVLRLFISDALDTHWQKAMLKLPPGMSQEEILDGGYALQVASIDMHAGRTALLDGMVLSHTLRYDPTPAQAAAGEPGDLIPIADWWDCLPPDDYKFIEAEIASRRGGVRTPAEAAPAGDATFPDAPGADDAQLHGGLPLPA